MTIRTQDQITKLQAALNALLTREPKLRRLSFKRMNKLIQKLDVEMFGE